MFSIILDALFLAFLMFSIFCLLGFDLVTELQNAKDWKEVALIILLGGILWLYRKVKKKEKEPEKPKEEPPKEQPKEPEKK